MTDLTGKFTDLKAALEGNHTETLTKLDDIIAALQPIPPSGATLQDVIDVLEVIQTGVQGTTNAVLSGNASLLLIRNSLGSLVTLQSTANSTLAAMLNFFTTNDWCCTGPIGSPNAPPLTTTPSTDDGFRCQKAQLGADLWVEIIDLFDVLLSGVGPTTVLEVFTAYQNVMLVHSVPNPSQPELSLITYTINRAREAGLSNMGGLAFSFREELSNVLYTSTNASLARQNIISWSQSHFGDPFTRDIMAYTLHNALLNEIYLDSGRNLDASGYATGVCDVINTGCIATASTAVSVTPSFGHSPRQQAVFATMGPLLSVVESSPGLTVTYGEPVVMTSGFQGGRIYYKSGRVRVVYGIQGVTGFEFPLTQPGNWVEIPLDADFLILDDSMYPSTTGTGPFEATFCTAGDV